MFSYLRYACRVVGGPDIGLRRQCDGPELVIGTAPGNHLALSDPRVAPHHCAIRVAPAGFQVQDLGSATGTWVGGLRVESAYIESGAVICIGTTLVELEVLAGEVLEPMWPERQFGPMLGDSPEMRQLFARARQMALADVPVLVEGGPGSGKTSLATAVHENSVRRDRPLVVVEGLSVPCRLPRALLEEAHCATLLVEEIAGLGPAGQRDLRDLMTHQLGRPGAREYDVLVLATTTRDLRAAVNEGIFNAELLALFHGSSLRLPGLGERPDDVAVLIDAFWRESVGDPAVDAPDALVARLQRLKSVGTVRELRHVVEFAADRRLRQRWIAAGTRAPATRSQRGEPGNVVLLHPHPPSSGAPSPIEPPPPSPSPSLSSPDD